MAHPFFPIPPSRSHAPSPGELEWKGATNTTHRYIQYIYNMHTVYLQYTYVCVFISILFTTSKDDDLSNATDVANFLFLCLIVLFIEGFNEVKKYGSI